MLSRMELRHVPSFLSLAKTLNFSRTAEIVHLSQPALSLQIQALEEGSLDLGFFVDAVRFRNTQFGSRANPAGALDTGCTCFPRTSQKVGSSFVRNRR